MTTDQADAILQTAVDNALLMLREGCPVWPVARVIHAAATAVDGVRWPDPVIVAIGARHRADLGLPPTRTLLSWDNGKGHQETVQ